MSDLIAPAVSKLRIRLACGAALTRAANFEVCAIA